MPNLRPEKDIWNLSNDEFYDPKAKSEKGTRGAGVGGLLQHSTPAIELQAGHIFTNRKPIIYTAYFIV